MSDSGPADPSATHLPLKKFECQRCNECCRQRGFVYLKKEEEERIAAFLGLDPFEFVNRFCELVDRVKLVLKKNPDESCVFLSNAGCSVHPVKPVQCVDFPIGWRTPRSFEYCAGLRKLAKEFPPEKN